MRRYHEEVASDHADVVASFVPSFANAGLEAIVVEDDPLMLELLSTVLLAQKIVVHPYLKGEEGLSHFINSFVPLIVLDWLMPGLDGLEVCRKIRALPNGHAVFILIVTARSSVSDMKEVLEAGANDYVTKPLDLQLLTIRVAVAAQQTRQLIARRAAEYALRSKERQVRALLEGAPLALFGVDFNENIIIAEGKIVDDVFGKKVTLNDKFSDLTGNLNLLNAVRRKIPSRHVLHQSNRDYEIRITYDAAFPEYITIVAIDITSRQLLKRELEEALLRVKSRYQDTQVVLDQLGVGMAVLNEKGQLTFLNQAACEYLRLQSSDVIGHHWQEVFFFSDHGITVSKLLSSPNPRPAPVTIKHADRTLHFRLEIVEDPRKMAQKILIFNDTTEVFDLRKMLQNDHSFHGIYGLSEVMMKLRTQIQEASVVDWTAMIEGDTGTGKELVARAIHAESSRQKGPFIAVNCAGLSLSLLQSQLFGHRKGAFTGAVRDQAGYFESAQSGTIFLDEIGDIAPEVQTTLLRVLEDHSVTRLGESRSRKVNVRVIVATNRNLSERVKSGHFRADLLYRIRVVRIHLSPLKDRLSDIPQLVSTFLSRANAMTGKHIYGMSEEAMNAMMLHNWPGNVRELKTSIEFASTRCRTEWILFNDLPPEIQSNTKDKISEKVVNDSFELLSIESERDQIIAVMKSVKGNRSKAANKLGMSRATFYRRLTKYRIDPRDYSWLDL